MANRTHDAMPATESTHADVAVITDAEPSYEESFRARRRRYVIMMAMRLPCLVLAVVLYRTPWLALLIILVSIPLPWMAVLIANDGPAKKRRRTARGVVTDSRAISPATHHIVEAGTSARP